MSKRKRLTRDLTRPNRFLNGDTVEFNMSIEPVIIAKAWDPVPPVGDPFRPLPGDIVKTQFGRMRVVRSAGNEFELEPE